MKVFNMLFLKTNHDWAPNVT